MTQLCVDAARRGPSGRYGGQTAWGRGRNLTTWCDAQLPRQPLERASLPLVRLRSRPVVPPQKADEGFYVLWTPRGQGSL
jgi:hypothetical protein